MARKHLVVGSIVVVSLAVAVTGYVLAVSFEPQDVGRASIAYFVAIPDTIKRTPVVRPCDKPRYGFVRHDGLTPSFATVRYASSASRDDILAEYTSYFASGQCAIREEGATLWAEACAEPVGLHSADVAVDEPKPGEECRSVVLSAVGE